MTALNSSKSFLLLISLFILVLTSCTNSHSDDNQPDNNLVSPSEYASIINENLPIMIGNNIRFDNVAAWEDKFIYNYTMLSYRAEEINEVELRSSQVPIMTNKACTLDEFKNFFDKDIEVTFNYFGRNGKKITSIVITKDACK